jgi:hypothetical protein
MKSPSKKADLVEILTALSPIWDLAPKLCETVKDPNFPEEEIDELVNIISDAVGHVTTSGKIERMHALKNRVQEMLEKEKAIKKLEDQASHSLLSSI